jgi:hypothetical protein
MCTVRNTDCNERSKARNARISEILRCTTCIARLTDWYFFKWNYLQNLTDFIRPTTKGFLYQNQIGLELSWVSNSAKHDKMTYHLCVISTWSAPNVRPIRLYPAHLLDPRRRIGAEVEGREWVGRRWRGRKGYKSQGKQHHTLQP